MNDHDADLERARADLAAAHAEIEELAGQLDELDIQVDSLRDENEQLRFGLKLLQVPNTGQEGTKDEPDAAGRAETWADRQHEPGER